MSALCTDTFNRQAGPDGLSWSESVQDDASFENSAINRIKLSSAHRLHRVLCDSRNSQVVFYDSLVCRPVLQHNRERPHRCAGRAGDGPIHRRRRR